MKTFLLKFSVIWCYFHCFYTFSQNNLQFYGDTGQFIINDSTILLQANEPGESVLHLDYLTPTSFEIFFILDLNFSPSTNNYFSLDFANNDLESFKIHIGESGTSDGLDLYVGNELLQNGIITNLSEGAQELPICLKWENDTLKSYTRQNNDWILEHQAQVPITWSQNRLSIRCKYTSSNLQNFKISNFRWTASGYDEEPPELTGYEWVSFDTIQFLYNEALSSASFNNNESGNGWVNQNTFFYVSNEPLSLLDTLEGWIDAKDAYGNTSETELTIPFKYPKMFDLVFSEFMIDPTPSLGSLEEEEFIEIYNRTGSSINLANYHLQINEEWYSIGDTAIAEEQFYVMYDAPSLSNSQFEAKLWYKKKVLIDYWHFDHDNFLDSEKRNGGWSVERNNLHSFDFSTNNWQYHKTFSGGSPHFINSCNDAFVDVEPPFLYKIIPFEEGYILLFNKMIDKRDGLITNVDTVVNASFQLKNYWSFNQVPIQDTVVMIEKAEMGFNQLLITEVLGDGCADTPDYLEITNVSNKAFLLNELMLQKMEDGNVVGSFNLPKQFILPGESRVFTASELELNAFFLPQKHYWVQTWRNMPSIPDDKIHLRLITKEAMLIDEIFINRSNLQNEEKYNCNRPIERMHAFNKLGTDSSNWSYAPANANFNSIARFEEYEDKWIPELLSLKSFRTSSAKPLELNYQFNGNAMVNITVFDLNGTRLASVIESELIAFYGTLKFHLPKDLQNHQVILKVEVNNHGRDWNKKFVVIQEQY